MRVIAGSAGGIRLDVPKQGVRPTMDRVKAAIFSSLGETILGAKVLDLFAGAGGLGIEALSRGAASAVFVDSDRQSVRAIEANLKRTSLAGTVRSRDVFDFLRPASSAAPFDIVFADPPYEPTASGASYSDLLLTNEFLPAVMATDGTFVLEKRPEEKIDLPARWKLLRAKKYGATEVLFLSRALEARGGGGSE